MEGVPATGGGGVGGDGGAGVDSSGNGEGMEEVKEEAGRGWDETERQREEDAAGGGTKEEVVGQEEGFVGVVV